MKTLLLAIFSIFCCLNTQAQIISQFNWDSNPVTAATVGPDAISVSSSAVSDAGGVGGTNGLNPSLSGTPKLDIDFTLPDSSIFNVPGIDFSIDYHREESVADLFTRGSSLVIGGGNQFNVSYRVDDGAGGFTTVSSPNNAYSIPNDDTYRTYRFYYLPTTGEGFLTVDGVQVWTNDGPDNRDMYWVGAGNIVIGNSLDGSGNNDTHLDNMIIGSVTFSALPVDLVDFSVKPENNTALIEWKTASEENNDYFEIEKSEDGDEWQKLGTVKGAGNKVDESSYKYVDEEPLPGISYYRLKQIDFDGRLEVFEPVSLDYPIVMMAISEFKIYPNPADHMITIAIDYLSNKEIRLFSVTGELMVSIFVGDTEQVKIDVDVSNFPPGTYIASDGETSCQFVKR